MRVIRLTAENFLRLRAVDITPTADVVKVSGANGAGKTSTLDAIWAALDHRRLNATEQIHKGAKKAVIKLNLGEIQVERVITQKSTELKVTMADGSKVTSPQKFLDAMLGELTFDPLAFDRMQPRDQFEQLRRAVKVDFDFASNASARQRAFDLRTEKNRQAKAKRAQAEGLPLGSPTQLIDEAPLLDQMQAAGEQVRKVEEQRAQILAWEKEADHHAARRKKNQAEIERLKAEIVACTQLETELLERVANAPELPEPFDVAQVRAALARVQAHNANVRQGEKRKVVEQEAEAIEAEAAKLTGEMEALDAAKEAVLSAAGMPVAGLALGDGEVVYNGFPYAQASAAERLRVSMAIAMAANPKIRVIRISDGSLLDKKSMAIVEETARANDFQVWCELVDETRQIGIVIEEGAVVAQNP